MYLVAYHTHSVASNKKNIEGFVSSANKNGFNSRPSLPSEKQEDIDLVLWRGEEKSKPYAAAIKGTLLKKSKKRKHLWGWVELRDRHGKDGWLYTRCNFIVYERKNDFVLIFKKALRDCIQSENIARWDLPFVTSGWKAAYRLYRRENTKEAIFHFKISDALKKCKHHIWDKV